MQTEYTLYRWPTDQTVTAEVYGRHPSIEAAAAEAARHEAMPAMAEPSNWVPTRDEKNLEPRGALFPQRTRTPWLIAPELVAQSDAERIELAIEVIVRNAFYDGSDHTWWVFDQALRHLAGERYAQVIADAPYWDEGVAP